MRVPRLVVLMVVLGACAEGVTVGPEASTRLPISEAPASAEVPMAGSVADEEPVEPMMPMTTAYTGESCVMNEPVTCICEDTGTEGQRRCLFDPNSPTQGTLSDTCERCAPPAEPEAEEPEAPSDTPDASGSEPDPAPDPDPAPEPPPDPPDPPEPPEPEPECRTSRDCPDDSILTEPCCTDDGQCGTEPALGLFSRCEV